jgi:hypothetical protein
MTVRFWCVVPVLFEIDADKSLLTMKCKWERGKTTHPMVRIGGPPIVEVNDFLLNRAFQ